MGHPERRVLVAEKLMFGGGELLAWNSPWAEE